MNGPSKISGSAPPYNPGVRDLVEGKRKWTSRVTLEDLKRGFHGWKERGYLPHRDEPGLTQFVTFHLADSFPESIRSEWEHLAKIESDRRRRTELEAYLDKGRGACYLNRLDVRRLVERNFRQFAGKRYELRAWVVMSNHVHVLFKTKDVSMSEIIGAWKRHTARHANELIGRRGAFWAEDYFDVYMRDSEHERRTVQYIESNPTKARLVLNPKEWIGSSAQFRDEFGKLSAAG